MLGQPWAWTGRSRRGGRRRRRRFAPRHKPLPGSRTRGTSHPVAPWRRSNRTGRSLQHRLPVLLGEVRASGHEDSLPDEASPKHRGFRAEMPGRSPRPCSFFSNSSMAEERLDESEAIACLNRALALQYRSALQYSIVAASLKGLEAQSLSAKLTHFGDEELSGARQLIEKIVSFGGEPTTETAPLKFEVKAADAIAGLSVARKRSSRHCRTRSSQPAGRAVRGPRAHARAPDHAQAGRGRLPPARSRPLGR